MGEIKVPKYYRQKFLLALLQAFSGKLKRTELQKYLFLSQRQYRKISPEYYFVPYKFGPFSFQAYADIRRMDELGIVINKDLIQIKTDSNYLALLKMPDRNAITATHSKYGDIKGNKLIKFIYSKYPYYAIKSELSIMQPEGENPFLSGMDKGPACFSLGYEGLTIDQYLNRIIQNNVRVVIDVRKNPVSMKYGFSKKTLVNALDNLKIGYLNLPELGIHSEFRRHLTTYDDYEALFNEYEKNILRYQNDALEIIADEYKKHKRIALTCFEKDYRYCHRSRICSLLKNEFDIKTGHL